MTVSKSVSRYFIAVGVTEVVLTMALVVCSAIVLYKYLDTSGVEAYALLLLFYVIPASLCILSGTRQKTCHIIIAIIINLISIILSTVGASVSSVFWRNYRDEDCSSEHGNGTECICFHDESFRMSCSDAEVAGSCLAVLTTCYILMTLTTFLATALGCSVVCCDPNSQPDTATMEASQTDRNSVVTYI